jgi:hypothetical protein
MLTDMTAKDTMDAVEGVKAIDASKRTFRPPKNGILR